MTATNQQMTSQQLDELIVVAVSMQRDAEKLDERPVAVFAYAVQLALAELQNTRQQLAAVVSENAGLKSAITTHSQSTHFCEVCGKDDPCSTDDVCYALNETPATDAYLAELGAQIRNELIDELESRFTELSLSETLSPELKSGAAGAAGLVSTFRREPDNEFAAQLRQGAEHE